MRIPEDVSGALRAVWEVRRGEEREHYCLGAWQNIVFGLMSAVLFGAYGLAAGLGLTGPLLHWLWLPPLLAAYTTLAFMTKRVLRLPRPTLPWREVALGTGLFVVLMGLLALAVLEGVVQSVPAGMSLVIGAFYILLGLVLLHERAPALFGLAVAAGALALLLLGQGLLLTTLYGIFVASGGMVAMGVWMLRHPPPRDTGFGGGASGDAPEDLEQVRQTLASLRGHERELRAREQAAKTLLAAAVLALAGVVGLLGGGHPYPWALLGMAGLTAGVGLVRQRAASREAEDHGA